MMRRIQNCLVAVVILFASSAHSRTIEVPSQLPTIQEAIDSSSNGDTVAVLAGIYVENVSFLGKGIYLRAMAPPESTVITPADSLQPIVSFTNDETSTAKIDGFTVRGTLNAPGINCYDSEPEILNCIITNCRNELEGGGIRIERGKPRISDCIISGNTALLGGGGVYIGRFSEAEISYCQIFENWAPNGSGISVYDTDAYAMIHRNLIRHNGGPDSTSAGIYADMAYVTIRNNTIVSNRAGAYFQDPPGIFGSSNIYAYNSDYGMAANVSSMLGFYSLFWENGNDSSITSEYAIIADPYFVDTANLDYHLQPHSMCIDNGWFPDSQNDSNGTQNDIGAFPYEQIFPVATDLMLPHEQLSLVVSHHPTFAWKYLDTTGSPQTAVEIEVGTMYYPFSGELFNTVMSSDADTLVYAGDTLYDGQTYYARIRADNGANWGDWSYRTFTLNNQPTVPVPLHPINGDSVPAHAARLEASLATDADSAELRYEFYIYDDTLSGVPAFESIANKVPFSKIFDSLESGQRYWWRVRAYDLAEYSHWSDWQTFIAREKTTWHVPDEYPTIQAAVDVASSGDTILLGPGTYTGDGNRDIELIHKGLVFIGEYGRESTVIDAGGQPGAPHSAFHIGPFVDSNLAFEGITFTGGYSDSSGGAILIDTKSPFEIKNCYFSENEAVTDGGAINCRNCGVIVDSCLFEYNSAANGGAVYDAARIENCMFEYNSASNSGAAVYRAHGASIKGSKFQYNYGADEVIFVAGSYFTLENSVLAQNDTRAVTFFDWGIWNKVEHCTFVGNTGVIRIGYSAFLYIRSCLIAYNTGPVADCFRCPPDCPYSAQAYIFNSNIYGHSLDYAACFGSQRTLNNNLSVDPLFCDTAALDFHLKPGSPCLGAGENGTNIGAFGSCLPTDADDDEVSLLPKSFALSQNYPNPFNPSTKLTFDVSRRSHVTLEIYNILGQRVVTLIDAEYSAGQYAVTWDGRNADGAQAASGVYFTKMTTSNFTATRKMVLLK